jgi:hypothetical protein
MGPLAKTALRNYRAAESLEPTARARALDQLRVRIAAGDWPAHDFDVAPPQPPAQGLLAKAIAGPLGKIGLAVIVAALPAAWLLHSTAHPPAEPQRSTPVPSRVQVTQPQLPEPAPLASSAASETVPPHSTATEAARVVTPAPRPELPVRRQTHMPAAEAPTAEIQLEEAPEPPKQSVQQPAGAPPLDMIDEEVRLLSQAHAALRSGRPREALAKLSEHERRFPNSRLAEARQVARMIGLCDSGRRALARAEARAFLAARPTSPLANRVRSICVPRNDEQQGP